MKLFIAENSQQWGKIDISQNHVELEPRDLEEAHEIFDFAAGQTLLKEGTVYAFPRKGMPGETPLLAAISRYSNHQASRPPSHCPVD